MIEHASGEAFKVGGQFGQDALAIWRRPAQDREHPIEDFLRTHDRRLRVIARGIASDFGMLDELDLVHSVVRVAAWNQLKGKTLLDRGVTFPESLEYTLTNFIRRDARQEMTRVVQDDTGFSGVKKLQIRRAKAERYRQQLKTLWGVEPTDEELITEFNTYQRETLADAARQSMILSQEDLDADLKMVHDPDNTILPAAATRDAGNDDWDEVTVREVVETTLRRCQEASPQTGMVADLALGTHLVVRGELTFNARELARETGLTSSVVAVELNRVREIAAEIIDEFSA